MEIYKIIFGFENYAVSDAGNIKSLKSGKILKPDTWDKNMDGFGYCRVSLSKEGKVTKLNVHRLVAELFVANPENKPFINHIDNNPENNSKENLEWCTHSENMIHCVKSGRSTYSLAANKAAEGKRGRKEVLLREKLGTNFVSLNPGKPSTVTYLCEHCGVSCTSRLDSSALAKEKTLCKPCAYKFR